VIGATANQVGILVILPVIFPKADWTYLKAATSVKCLEMTTGTSISLLSFRRPSNRIKEGHNRVFPHSQVLGAREEFLTGKHEKMKDMKKAFVNSKCSCSSHFMYLVGFMFSC
jgi:hypothetical protein